MTKAEQRVELFTKFNNIRTLSELQYDRGEISYDELQARVEAARSQFLSALEKHLD